MSNPDNKILELISEQFGTPIEKLTREVSFKDDLNADSLDLVELIMAIELELGLEAEDGDLESIATIGDCLDYVNKVQNA